MHVAAHGPMKGLHFGGRQATVAIGIGRLEGRHAPGAHALMFDLELGPTQMTVVVGIECLEALLMKALGGLAMLGLVVMVIVAVTLTMGTVPMRTLGALSGRLGGCSGWRTR